MADLSNEAERNFLLQTEAERNQKASSKAQAGSKPAEKSGSSFSFTNYAKNVGRIALAPAAIVLEGGLIIGDAISDTYHYAVNGVPYSLGEGHGIGFTKEIGFWQWDPLFVDEEKNKKSNAAAAAAAKAAEDAKKRAELEAKQQAARNRLAEQAALILSIEDVVKGNGKAYNRKNTLYRNFGITRIDEKADPRSNGDTLHKITNFITKRKGMEIFFKNMPTALLSALVPSIKIYKVFYPEYFINQGEDPKKFSKERARYKGYDWRIPFDDMTFGYGDQSSEFLNGQAFVKIKTNEDEIYVAETDSYRKMSDEERQANRVRFGINSPEGMYQLDKSKFGSEKEKKFLQPATSLHAVGIKNFSYSYDGTDPFTISTNISAELELYFRNIEDILKEITFTSTDPRFVSNVDAKYGNVEFKFSYADLIYNAPYELKVAGSDKLKLNPEYYTLKVVFGYMPIEPSYWRALTSTLIDNGLNEEDIRNLKEAIESSQQTFILNPWSHDLNFGEDGSVTMKIKCNSYINTAMAMEQTDIFKSSEESKEVIKLQLALENFIKTENKLLENKTKELKCAPYTEDIIKEKIDQYEKSRGKINEKIKKQFENRIFYAKKNMYNSIYRRLIGVDATPGREKDMGIYSAHFKTNLLGLDNKGQAAKDATAIRKAALQEKNLVINFKRLNVTDTRSLRLNILEGGPPQEVTEEAKKRAREQGKSEPTQETVAEIQQKSVDKQKQTVNVTRIRGQNYSKIKYIFLGDILDAAAECINNLLRDGTDDSLLAPRIVLGEIGISIPTKYENTIAGFVATDAKQIFINIADIPISFDYFQQFMLERVIQPMRDSYPLLEFIRDLINTLITDALKPEAFGRTLVKSEIKISTKVMQIPFSGEENNPLSGLEPTSFRGPNGLVPAITPELVERVRKDVPANQRLAENEKDKYISKSYPVEVSNYSMRNPSKISGILNYYFIFSFNNVPKYFNGDVESDEKNGVYHFRIGSDSSIVKKITFNKTEVAGMREYAASQNGMNNAAILKQHYTANVDMFGNNIYNIGDYIFVEPIYSNGRRVLNLQDKLGLGGYYQITSVKGGVSDMNFNVSLKCSFVAPVVEIEDGLRKITELYKEKEKEECKPKR